MTEILSLTRFLSPSQNLIILRNLHKKKPLLLSPYPIPNNSINSKWLSVTEAVVAAVVAAPGAVDEVALAVEVDSAADEVVVLPVAVVVVEVSCIPHPHPSNCLQQRP